MEQLLPLPYPITEAEMQQPNWIPSMDGVQGQMYQIKPYASFQAFPYADNLAPDEITTDTRLIGRSVWNTKWVLVIPGSALMADPEEGLARFVEDVDDIYIYFQTYSYAGTRHLRRPTWGMRKRCGVRNAECGITASASRTPTKGAVHHDKTW